VGAEKKPAHQKGKGRKVGCALGTLEMKQQLHTIFILHDF
jgi:hypothetical protein